MVHMPAHATAVDVSEALEGWERGRHMMLPSILIYAGSMGKHEECGSDIITHANIEKAEAGRMGNGALGGGVGSSLAPLMQIWSLALWNDSGRGKPTRRESFSCHDSTLRHA